MTNNTNTALYVGVTPDLKWRIHRHKANYYPGSFTARYRVHKLVYYKKFDSIIDAIAEEKGSQ